MDNLNFVTLGTALGLITLTSQLIDYRPLRNSFLVLILIWLFTLTPDFPWSAKDYYVFGKVFVTIIESVSIIMISMVAAYNLLMKGKDKKDIFLLIPFILIVLAMPMWVMLVPLINHAPLREVFLGGYGYISFVVLLTIAVIFLIVWLWKYCNIGEEYRKNRNKKIDIKNEIKLGRSYIKNNQGIILNTFVVIVLNILAIYYIILLINMAITIDNLFHEGNYLNVYVQVRTICLFFLGFILILHSSLLNDDLDWHHGEKTSKASILFIKLLLSSEMIIGVLCIFISTNTLALLY